MTESYVHRIYARYCFQVAFPQIWMTNNATTCWEKGISFILKNNSYKVCGQYFEFSCSGTKWKIYTWVFYEYINLETVVLRYVWWVGQVEEIKRDRV